MILFGKSVRHTFLFGILVIVTVKEDSITLCDDQLSNVNNVNIRI